jgi:hypothetical protein
MWHVRGIKENIHKFEFCALLGCYVVSSGNYLPTLRDKFDREFSRKKTIRVNGRIILKLIVKKQNGGEERGLIWLGIQASARVL